jgi:hypothetical protein
MANRFGVFLDPQDVRWAAALFQGLLAQLEGSWWRPRRSVEPESKMPWLSIAKGYVISMKVSYWHFSEVADLTSDVRCWGTIRNRRLGRSLPKMTLNGHRVENQPSAPA